MENILKSNKKFYTDYSVLFRRVYLYFIGKVSVMIELVIGKAVNLNLGLIISWSMFLTSHHSALPTPELVLICN